MKSFSRYTLHEELGRGHSAVVYRAADSLLGEVVAIKVFNEGAGIPKQEMTLGQKVRHDNIIQIRHYEFIDNRHCIIMEFAPVNLRARMGGKPIPVEEGMPIVFQLLNGLDAA